jgi:glycosyltransferase involved in cell wall biosynthesis
VKPKKILFLITKGNFGGAQRYVFDLATGLPKEEFKVAVGFGAAGVLEEKLKEADIETFVLPSLHRDVKIWDELKTFIDLTKLIKSVRPDVLHVNSSKMAGLGALAGRVCGVKNIIFTAHGLATNEHRSWFSKKIMSLIYYVIMLLSHHTIAVCAQIAKQLSKYPFIKMKIKVVYNGINTFEMLDGFESRQILAPQAHEEVWIGTIAELHNNKGLDILIKSFAEITNTLNFNNVSLVIIGGGEEKENLEKLIKELKLEKKVHLLGFIKDAHKYIKAFDIFTLPSRTEAFPYVILEAGLAGLPVVASSVGGIPEVVISSINGLLFHKGNEKELVLALTMLLNDKALAKSFGDKLTSEVKERFSIKQMLESTKKIYG